MSVTLEDVHVTTKRRGIAAIFGWAALALFFAPFVAPSFEGTLAAVLVTSFWGAPIAGLVALLFYFLGSWSDGSVSVDEREMHLPGQSRPLPITAVRYASINPLRCSVDVRMRSGDVHRLHVRSPQDARRILDEARLDAARRTMRMRLGENLFLDLMAWIVGLPMSAVAAVWLHFSFLRPPSPGVTMLTIVLLFGAVWWTLRRLLGPADMTVGADGITVKQGIRSRFVPYERIESVDIQTERVALLLDSGLVKARTRHLSVDQIAELRARIDDARAAWQAGAGEIDLASLERNGRAFDAWKSELRTLLARARGYRSQALSREDLVRVIESAATPVERRIGAAMALQDDEDARAKVRIAAGASANERVRVALAKAAAGDLDEAAVEAAIATERTAKALG